MFHQAFQIWEVQWETGENYYWLNTTEVCLANLKLDGLEFAKSMPCFLLIECLV